MLARVEIGYDTRKVLMKLSRPDYLKLKEGVWGLELPNWPEDHPDDKPHPAENWYKYGSDIIADDQSEVPFLREFGIAHTVKELKHTYKAVTPIPADGGPTTHISVHIPNIGLLSINEVTWIENACTEELQRKLDAGYRILAVCPPNGVRRPDYILGRTAS